MLLSSRPELFSRCIRLNIVKLSVVIGAREHMKHSLLAVVFLLALTLPTSARTQDLSSLSIAELLELDVTSVGKKSQKLSSVAAAVFVISNQDIRRSGATSIPEVLRLAPGIQVARIGAYRWAITGRGFNDAFAKNLLVLIDGRTVYTPLFGGVFWDSQDLLLEDVERIEVIRGPGASVWGANATNGVINIITKSSFDTMGTYVAATGGSEERYQLDARYGDFLTDDTSYRTFFRFHEHDDFSTKDDEGSDERGNWWGGIGGFRVDSDFGDSRSLSVQGDLLHGSASQELVLSPSGFPLFPDAPPRADRTEGNLLARYVDAHSDTSSSEVHAYYSFVNREDGAFRHRLHTFNIDYQRRYQGFDKHDVVWGLGYRLVEDKTYGDFLLSFDPDSRQSNLYSLFIQDEIEIVQERLSVLLGARLEHNDYSGYEWQPTIRGTWTPSLNQSYWLSLSKAVRVPSRLNDDLRTIVSNISPEGSASPVFADVRGDTSVESADLYAVEIGNRYRLTENLSYDLTAFYNYYDNFLSLEPGSLIVVDNPFSPYSLAPFTYANLLKAESHGVELFIDYLPFNWWRLAVSYTYFESSIYGSDSGDTVIIRPYDRNSSEHIAYLRSQFDLREDVELDLGLRAVDENRFAGDYAELDVRIAWSPSQDWTFSIVGQNLLNSSHQEWLDNRFGQPSIAIDRGVYVKVVWEIPS